MGLFGTVAAVLAVAGAVTVVLRDVTSYDRPPAPPRAVPPHVARAEPASDGTMLGALTTTEDDEHSPQRRMGALAVLMMLVFVAAAAIGFGIYRGVSALR